MLVEILGADVQPQPGGSSPGSDVRRALDHPGEARGRRQRLPHRHCVERAEAARLDTAKSSSQDADEEQPVAVPRLRDSVAREMGGPTQLDGAPGENAQNGKRGRLGWGATRSTRLRLLQALVPKPLCAS